MAHNSHEIPLENGALVEVINKYGLQPIWAQTYLTEDQRYANIESMLRTKHVQQSQHGDQLASLNMQLNNTNFANMNISLDKIQAMTDLKAINKRLSNRKASAVQDEAVWSLLPSIQDLEKGLHSEKRLLINLGKGGKTITAFNTLLDTRYYAGFKPGTPIFRVECPPPAVVVPATGSSAAGVPHDFFHLGLLPQDSLNMIDDQPRRRLKFVYEGRVPRSGAAMLARIGQLVPDVVVMIATIYLAAIPDLDTFLRDLLSGPRRRRDSRSVSASDLCMLHTMFVLFRESNIDFDEGVTKAFRYHPKVTELSALLATPRLRDLIKHLLPLIYIIERMTGHSMIRIARSKFDADAALARAEIGKTSNKQSIFFHADPLVSTISLVIFLSCPSFHVLFVLVVTPYLICCPPSPSSSKADKRQTTLPKVRGRRRVSRCRSTLATVPFTVSISATPCFPFSLSTPFPAPLRK